MQNLSLPADVKRSGKRSTSSSTLFWLPTGQRIIYRNGVLLIDDLNPEQHMTWAMSRWEMFRLGWQFIRAAIR